MKGEDLWEVPSSSCGGRGLVVVAERGQWDVKWGISRLRRRVQEDLFLGERMLGMAGAKERPLRPADALRECRRLSMESSRVQSNSHFEAVILPMSPLGYNLTPLSGPSTLIKQLLPSHAS